MSNGRSASTAHAAASRLLRKVKVVSAIERALNEISVSRVAVLAETASLALPETVRRGVTKLKLGEDGKIQEIEVGLRGASLAHLLRALRIDKPETLVAVNSGGAPIQIVLTLTDQLVLRLVRCRDPRAKFRLSVAVRLR